MRTLKFLSFLPMNHQAEFLNMVPNFLDSPGLYRIVLEELPLGAYIVDRHHRIRFWNRRAERIVGHLSHEVVGRISHEHIVEARDEQGMPLDGDNGAVTATLRDGQTRQLKAHYLHKEGHRVEANVRLQAIVRNGDVIEGALILLEEVADASAEAGPSAAMCGCLDAVTGVPSHRLTRAVLSEWLAGIDESRHGFGILRVRVLGLDEFRSRHGPHSAVPFMRVAASTLRHILGPENLVGRWGEDEFLVVLPSANSVTTKAAAETVWRLISQSEVRWWGDRFPVQAVVMHAVAQPGDKLEKLLNSLEPAHAAAAARAVGATSATR